MSANPHAHRRPGREQELLKLFLGAWNVEGHNAPSAPDAEGDAVTGRDVFELLPGGFFIQGHWDHTFASGVVFTGIAMLGYDPDEGSFFAHHYDNLGYPRRYPVTYNDRVFTYTGQYERATIVFSPDGQRMIQTWEMSDDGENWRPLCELHSSKQG
jgi:hypothetical protein